MGAIDRVIETLLKHPRGKEVVDDAIFKILAPGWFARKLKPSPKVAERRKALKALTQKLVTQNGEWIDGFTDRLDYFGALLGAVGETVEISDAGFVARRFFLERHYVYFPKWPGAIRGSLSLQRGQSKVNRETTLVQLHAKEYAYAFFAIEEKAAVATDLTDLRERLAIIAKSNPDSEEDEFLAWLRQTARPTLRLSGIGQSGGGQLSFVPGEVIFEELHLDLTDTYVDRNALGDDISQALDFRIVR